MIVDRLDVLESALSSQQAATAAVDAKLDKLTDMLSVFMNRSVATTRNTHAGSPMHLDPHHTLAVENINSTSGGSLIGSLRQPSSFQMRSPQTNTNAWADETRPPDAPGSEA
jgi:hypothetical protein